MKYLSNAQFPFHAASKPTGFVENMVPFATLKGFAKHLLSLLQQKFVQIEVLSCVSL